MGLKISLDAGLRFDENKARNDAIAIGRLSPSIHDQGVRRAAQAIARNLTQDVTTDDADDRVAALIDDLHQACLAWEK